MTYTESNVKTLTDEQVKEAHEAIANELFFGDGDRDRLRSQFKALSREVVHRNLVEA